MRMVCLTASLLFFGLQVGAQSNIDLARLAKVPRVPGHERELTERIAELLRKFSPKTDNLGNVYVTLGSGAPHRVIATAVDEPGYVVSGITEDGYLRVQRLPQAPPNPVFDTLNFAQPVWVTTREGKKVAGVFAGLSVHLQTGRENAPKMNQPNELYVDIGAKNSAEVNAAGVNVLDPVSLSLERREEFGFARTEWKPVGNGGRFGLITLLRLATQLDANKLTGSVTIAFVTQQSTGGRGLDLLLNELHPDELIYVGRISVKPASDAKPAGDAAKPGSGILLGISDATKEDGASLAKEIKSLAEKHKLPLTVVAANPPRMAGYAKGSTFPEKFVQLGVPDFWPVTPGECVDGGDVAKLEELLEQHAIEGAREAFIEHVEPRSPIRKLPLIGQLTEVYGASGHEGAVREEVKKLLPEWARKKATTDAAGNLVLQVGDGKRDEKTPRLMFVAHMDEIGYEVKKLEDDGRLQVEVLGGGYTQYFLGHVVLVHKKDGKSLGGVLELPEGWDKPGFEWPSGPRSMDEPAHVYLGTRSKEETEKLGIAAGDFVTIPKEYRPLLGTRANARSFDDRVGCAALIEAVKALGPELPGRDVTFVWSTEEEVGLKGAAGFAEQAAKEGRVPDFVFAIDTFVSSDSPLESKRFADAELGKGFVVRAVDNSNVVPLQYVDRVVSLAHENKIPVQYGVTGGGNDGAVFVHYGSVDVALGWPLRYSHSPAELIDTRDLDALGKIVEVLARKW
jgi:putative aminopeptidase